MIKALVLLILILVVETFVECKIFKEDKYE